MTDVERFVWDHLRGRRFQGFKFRRQVPVGSYIADFVCYEAKLILEFDGGQHASQKEYDLNRTQFLEAGGFRVLRFWNHVALEDWEIVEEVIWRALQDERVNSETFQSLHHRPLTPNPSPTRGEGNQTKGEGNQTGGEGNQRRGIS